ncbi:hypothetical protein DSCA_54940 [Desulfosarcina alkanivorans]|uniref:Porin domain-containing protein n=1 Tax=Desulfosarcina alkanivorans TaxID=571177 RepID=A0A5K7YZ76_9BACT|nr:porin [Desulfosarcina alkanivorans]BBO71564.1 hypothetical protein DSCA_54940 [Desulfosarcina alkanivorans]
MKNAFKHILIGFTLLTLTTSAYAAEVMGVDIHGFISQGYLSTSDNNFVTGTEDGTFEFNEFGINFGKELTDKLHVGMQLFSRDLGDFGDNEVTLDWAYGDYRWRDWLGIRVGKIKAPHGLYNESRDVDMVRTWVFLPQSVYPEIERDAALSLMGAGLYGNVDLGWFGGISYQAMVGTQNIDADESLAQSLMGINTIDTSVTAEDIDVDKKYAFSLTYDTPLDGLRIGGTFQYAEMDLFSTIDAGAGEGLWSFMPVPYGGYYDTELKSENYVASVEYTWENLVLVAEYTWSNREVSIASTYTYPAGPVDTFFGPFDLTDFNGSGAPFDNKSEGWYVGATYRFTDWFELGGYYSEYYPDRDDRDGSAAAASAFAPLDPQYRAYNKDFCLTTRFDINEYWAIKLEGHQFEGVALLPLAENVDANNNHTFEEDWQMFAAKVTFSF